MPEQRVSVALAAATGDRLKTLEALRERLALAIDVCTDAADLSSLALRLQRTLAEIHEMGGAAPEEDNELAERRKAKLSAAAGP